MRWWQSELDEPSSEIAQVQRNAAVLREQRASEARVLREGNTIVAGIKRLARDLRETCPHHDLSVHKYVSSPFDDHATQVGQCLTCKAWVHRTLWNDGVVDDRALTEPEMDALQRIEDRYRRGDAS
jgi:hypothetical protein